MSSSEAAAATPDMFSGPVGALLWRMALPIYASTLLWVVYTLTDIYWISRIDPENPAIVGGVSLIIPIYMLAFALSNGLLIGVKSLVARAIGSGNEALLNRVASAGLALAAIASIVFLALGYGWSEEIALSLGATGDMHAHAHTFLLFILPATALLFTFNVLSGIAQGEGQMKPVMHAMGLGVSLNLLLDPLLILVMGWGVLGAALATCLSQAISLLYLAWVFFQGGMRVPLHVNVLHAHMDAMGKILKVGLPQGLADILVAFYLFAINRIVVSIDPTAMTAFGLCARVDQLLLLSIAAISSAVLTAAAQNAARGNVERVRDIQRAAILGGAVLVLAQAALLVVFAPWIYGLLSDAEAVVAYAVRQTWIVNPFYVFAVPTLIYHAFFLAVGHPWPAITVQFLKMFVVTLPLVLLLKDAYDLGMYGLWAGIVAGEVAAAVMAHVWNRAYRKRLQQGQLVLEGA